MLPVSGVAELLYCPRNFYYRVVEGAEDTNVFVEKGVAEEERRDAYGQLNRGEYVQYRRVHVSSEKLGLSGVLDVVEEQDGQQYPVEYKSGSRGDKLNDSVQLCCQAMLLEEHLNLNIEKGYIYYAASKRRKEVWFEQSLRDITIQTVREAKRIIEAGEIPNPVADSRCNGCSLAARCLHEEVSNLTGGSPPRRPLPGINLGRTLYVDTPGTYLRKRGERVVVTKEDEKVADIPLTDLDQVVIATGVNASASLLTNLLKRGVPTFFITRSGRLDGWLNPCWNRNILLRQDQFRVCQQPQWQLNMAKRFVGGKIANMRTMLKRYERGSTDEVLTQSVRQLSILGKKVTEASSIDNLRGLEGNASKQYFQVFGALLKEKTQFDFSSRNRRPPKDPVNALLSFGYAMLTKDVTSTLMLIGLDPYQGIYHVAHYGRPALALDLMEEFRSIIVDSVVLTVINKGTITLDDFEDYFGGVILKEHGRKKFFTAYQQRMMQQITHPVFEYNLPYRRTIELQARFLAKVIRGELPEYKAFMVR